MSFVKHTPGHVYLEDGTLWPFPDDRFAEAAWNLRYGSSQSRERDRLYVAEVMNVYADLITHPAASLRAQNKTLRRVWKNWRKMKPESEDAK